MAEHRDRNAQTSRRIRLPGFVNDEDIGLGDLIGRITHTVAPRPCQGCAQRAAVLNRWVVFSGRHGGRPE